MRELPWIGIQIGECPCLQIYNGGIRREEDGRCNCLLQDLSYLARGDVKIMLKRLPLLFIVGDG